MPRKNEPVNLAAYRREFVAQLALRGFSVRTIAEKMALPMRLPSGETRPPILNPQTGKPFSKSVIANDLEAMRREWRKKREEHIEEHQAELLAKYREVERQAWKKGDYDLVLRALDHIAKLLGANAPVRREISGPGGAPIEVAAYSEEDAQELLERFRSETTLDITPHTDRLPLGLTMPEEPTNGKGNGNGQGRDS